ncbi:AAA family ATPase [Edaphocola aurantiacus]|uniref:AAA family ATPase n=1 Tax=Edaphocola aurantiacus TaxID=2601682 RepID=UPI001C96FF67|nr:ATP-binding protein [Edaphocola aurantiacus]
MLTRFSVANFKNFNKKFEFDLSDTSGYNFNTECIKNNIVNCALIYGHNGVGKSNLAYAIFDIIEHLTDGDGRDSEYENYLNAYNDSDFAEFQFEFLINSNKVIYNYRKTDYKKIIYEKLSIDEKEVVLYDRIKDSNAIIKLKGTETLKSEISNDELSILKYIKNNAELDDDSINQTFKDFFSFVESMLYFRSLRQTSYMGLESGKRDIFNYIIEQGESEEFELFLNEAGISCKLVVMENIEKKTLYFDFGDKYIPFVNAASMGTIALAVFYYWFIRVKQTDKVSFLFIDEFDAFYHHALSKLVVNKLKSTNIQFVLTTHNTSILSNDILRPDCYFVMDKESISPLSKRTEKELREAHNIEKMYKAGSFDVE